MRKNKYKERKFITVDTSKKIRKRFDNIKSIAIKDGLISNDTTLWDELFDVFLEELGEFALEIRKHTIENH